MIRTFIKDNYCDTALHCNNFITILPYRSANYNCTIEWYWNYKRKNGLDGCLKCIHSFHFLKMWRYYGLWLDLLLWSLIRWQGGWVEHLSCQIKVHGVHTDHTIRKLAAFCLFASHSERWSSHHGVGRLRSVAWWQSHAVVLAVGNNDFGDNTFQRRRNRWEA